MTIRAWLLVVVAIGVGCGSDDADSCLYDGVYTVHYDERSNGTCGPVPDDTVAVDEASGDPGACQDQGEWVITNDGCTRARTQTKCQTPEGYGETTVLIDYQSHGNWAGTASVLAPTCSSVYDVVLVQQ